MHAPSSRSVRGLHHVQVTHPPGGEDVVRSFYSGVLGLAELPKPPELAGRGGVWFAAGSAQLHFGVEEPGPDSRRHVALAVSDLSALRERLLAAGSPVEEAIPLEGMERFYCRDPFGNRIELLEATA
jgi:catechol 2,3-dioxygenase-like lactoylglutathione lyase family enzyme